MSETIEHIKKLLHYCPSGEIGFWGDEVSDYLLNKLNSSEFHKPSFDIFTMGLYLESISTNPTMFLKYEYESSWDNEVEFLLFNDTSAQYRDGGKVPFADKGPDLNYDFISPGIWKIIEKKVADLAEKHVCEELGRAKKTLEYRQKEYNDFVKLK